jgi:hypothetical protein
MRTVDEVSHSHRVCLVEGQTPLNALGLVQK